MSSDTERDAASFSPAVGKPGDTEKDLVSSAESPGLRLIAGGKTEVEAAPQSTPRRRRPIDKSARPAHQQLRLITVPPWLPWLAQLMAERQKRKDAAIARANGTSGVGATPAPPARRYVGILVVVLLIAAGIAAAGLWQRNPAPRTAPAATQARQSVAELPKTGVANARVSEAAEPPLRPTAAPAPSQPGASSPEHTERSVTIAESLAPTASADATKPMVERSSPEAAPSAKARARGAQQSHSGPAATVKTSPKGIDDWAL